jgi:hypothetical protein
MCKYYKATNELLISPATLDNLSNESDRLVTFPSSHTASAILMWRNDQQLIAHCPTEMLDAVPMCKETKKLR